MKKQYIVPQSEDVQLNSLMDGPTYLNVDVSSGPLSTDTAS